MEEGLKEWRECGESVKEGGRVREREGGGLKRWGLCGERQWSRNYESANLVGCLYLCDAAHIRICYPRSIHLQKTVPKVVDIFRVWGLVTGLLVCRVGVGLGYMT